MSHPVSCSVENQIPDEAGEMRYSQFQTVLQIVIQADKNYIILKRDIKYTFRNIPVASHYRWLLRFTKAKYYKKTCLLFGFSTALFIFNFLGEGLH